MPPLRLAGLRIRYREDAPPLVAPAWRKARGPPFWSRHVLKHGPRPRSWAASDGIASDGIHDGRVYRQAMGHRAPISRVTADDLMSLVSERGSTPMQVGAVLMLDARSGLDPARAIDVLGGGIAAVPRLRQRLEQTPFGCGRPVWVDDPDFKVTNHMTVVPCPAPGGEPMLLVLAAELVGAPLSRIRPLWTATLVTDTAPGEAALILVFHHVLADGIGGLAVLARLVEGAVGDGGAVKAGVVEGDAPAGADLGFPRPAPSRTALFIDAARGRIRSLRRLPAALKRLGGAAAELRPAARAGAARTSLNRPTGPRPSFAGIRVDVNRVHRVAHAHGATVNDVVLTAVAGALHQLLERRGEQADEIVISVPFSARRTTSAADLGNQSGVIPLAIPAAGGPTQGGPGTRLEAAAALTRAAKRQPAGASTSLLGPLFRLLARVGLYQRFITRQRMIHTFASTMRGPETRKALFGCPITGILPLSVPTGNVTVSFVMLSYAGELAVTIVADPDACTDLPVLRELLAGEFEALVALDG
jgi:diacylglycerol O-acyltransferase